MKELMLTSSFSFEGYRITEYMGFVSGECVLGTGFFSTLNMEIADFLGVPGTQFQSKLSKAT